MPDSISPPPVHERDLTTAAALSDSSFADRTTSQLTYSLGLRWQMSEWIGWRVD